MQLQRIESKNVAASATLADLLTLLEQGKIVLFGKIQTDSAIARRVARADKFVGMATASLSTYVPLPQSTAAKVIRTGEATLHRIRVRASELSDWNPEFPYEDIDSISGIDEWEGTSFDTAKRKTVELLLEPTLGSDFRPLLDILQKFDPNDTEIAPSGMPKLSTNGYTLKALDLFVDPARLKDALNSVSLVDADKLNSWQSLSTNDISRLIEKAGLKADSLNIILFRLIADNRSAPMKQLWAALESDHQDGVRLYDTDYLIDDLVIDKLIWLNRNRLKVCSYGSAKNRISKLKTSMSDFFSQKVS